MMEAPPKLRHLPPAHLFKSLAWLLVMQTFASVLPASAAECPADQKGSYDRQSTLLQAARDAERMRKRSRACDAYIELKEILTNEAACTQERAMGATLLLNSVSASIGRLDC